jgi:hypothetical protein
MINKCIVEGCAGKQFWGKYCEKHYNEEFNRNKHLFAEYGVAR